MYCLWPARFISQLRRYPASTKIPTFDVANSLFHTAVLRIPSINALEGDLRESDFQKLIGRQPTPDVKAFSADVVANVLDKLQLQGIRKAIHEVINKAEQTRPFATAVTARCAAWPSMAGNRFPPTIGIARTV